MKVLTFRLVIAMGLIYGTLLFLDYAFPGIMGRFERLPPLWGAVFAFAFLSGSWILAFHVIPPRCCSWRLTSVVLFVFVLLFGVLAYRDYAREAWP